MQILKYASFVNYKNVEDVYPCNQVCVVPCSCCDNILISKSHVEKHISYHTTFPVPVVRLIYLVRYCGYQTQTLISNTGKKVSGRNPLKIKKSVGLQFYSNTRVRAPRAPTHQLQCLCHCLQRWTNCSAAKVNIERKSFPPKIWRYDHFLW